MLMKKIIIAAALILAAIPMSAQRLQGLWDYHFYFDNREFDRGGEAFAESMTLHAVRFTPYIVLNLDSPQPARRSASRYGRRSGYRWPDEKEPSISHRFVAGLDVVKHMGDGRKNSDLFDELSLFYDYEQTFRRGQSFSMVAGVLPRTLTEGYYSRLIFSDAVKFTDHNIEGLLLKYRNRQFFSELWCDWMGQYGVVSRERFQINTAGEWQLIPIVSLGWNASLYHFACSELEHYVVDNALGNLYARLDMSRDLGYQRMNLTAGVLSGYQRDRREKLSVVPVGFECVLDVKNRNLGVENTLVYAPDMMVNYGLLGSDLYFGSPYYHTKVNQPRPYDRLEIYWEPRLGARVQARVSMVCHFAQGREEHFAYQGMQQRFSLYFPLDLR